MILAMQSPPAVDRAAVTATSTTTTRVVLVHGAWHGAWCWDKVLARLEVSGVPAVAIDLPGHGDSPEQLGDLYADAASLRAVLDRHPPGSVVLAAHSYGGAVITEAGDHPAVRHLVYVAAFLLDRGECVFDAASPEGIEDVGELGSIMRKHADGTWTIDVAGATAVLYDDCDDADVGRALLRLDSHRTAAFAQSPGTLAWQTKPTTYVVCTADRAVSEPVQRRMAGRAGAVVECASGHSPFLSKPERLASLLHELATT
jgi:pimeloyl-ACP methyl ester carboxylesterase